MSDTTDPLAEIEAMRTIAQALQPLDDASRRRVFTWASDKFIIPSVVTAPQLAKLTHVPEVPSLPQSAQTSQAPNGELTSYGSIADLFHACNPRGDSDKALVAGVWLQIARAVDGLDSMSVNGELKHLGYGVGNITRALQNLVEAKPALMIQLRKSGTTQQARKVFKVTDAGMKRIKDMIAENKAQG